VRVGGGGGRSGGARRQCPLPLTQKPPWNDPQIRHALAKAIPYNDILQGVFKGRAKPYQSILLPFLPEYTSRFAEKTDYNAARRVLSQVMEPLTLAYSKGLAIDEQVAILVQQGMKKAGFDLKLEKQPVGDFSTKRVSGGNAFYVDNLANPGIAAVDYYFLLYGGKDGFFNTHKYYNPEFEKQIKLSTSSNAAVRARAALEGQRIFMRDLPFIPVAWGGNNFAISKQLTIPFAHTANGLVNWREFKT
jgi:peptide/nickel transport system substrate-binding protein